MRCVGGLQWEEQKSRNQYEMQKDRNWGAFCFGGIHFILL
jgi:hypothetical protein